jgi:YbbR domain-containing protein
MSETIQSPSPAAEKEKDGRRGQLTDPVLKELTSSASGPVVEDAADVDAAQHWQEAARAAAHERGVLAPAPAPPRPRPRPLPALFSSVRWERLTRLVLAFLMAILLWLYVMGLDNPAQSAVYPNLPITVRGLTTGLDVRNTLGTATLEVRAPADVMEGVNGRQFQVYVDVTGLGAGTHTAEVKIQHTSSQFMTIRVDPPRVAVQLGLLGEATLPVRVRPIGQPGVGYQVETEQVDPQQVTITGPQEQVDRVASIVAELNLEGKQGTQTGQVRPRALDASGREVAGLTFDPEFVQAAVAVRLLVDFKTVAVHVPLTGDPAPGHRVTDITVDPSALIVQGLPSLLESVTVLDTTPVILEGLTQTVTSSAEVLLPPGVILSANEPMSVTVRVVVEELTTRLTQSVKVRPLGLGTGLEAVVSPEQVEVRVSGPFEALQTISPDSLQATVDLATLIPGTYVLTPTIGLPTGTKAVSVTPNAVTVTITAPAPPTPVPTTQPIIVDTPAPGALAPGVPPTNTPTGTPTNTPTPTPTDTPTPRPATGSPPHTGPPGASL